MDEDAVIDELAGKPLSKRVLGYFKLTGPGYMQSAMTLGGGSVASCAAFGSLLGYELLWVQPLAMLLGYFVLAGVAKQTVNSGERTYKVFWDRLHPGLAIIWGVSAFVATIIWHMPQYSLTANGVVTLSEGAGLNLDHQWGRILIGAVALPLAGYVVYLYHRGARGLHIYETAVKSLVWAIVIAFGIVVFATGVEWGRFFTGITGIDFIRDLTDADGLDPDAVPAIVAGLAAAVGINMIFLYPYSLLNKNWGKKHKELAYFDLISGMAVPFILATGLMIIAVSNTIGPAHGEVGSILEGEKMVRDIRDIIPVLAPTFGGPIGDPGGLEEGVIDMESVAEAYPRGSALARLLIGLGITAIGFSTIITHMLAAGFIGCEMFGYTYEGRAKMWFSYLPAIMVVGVVFPFPIPLAITASTLAAPLMPLAVLCFLILMNMKSYMGDAMPKGGYRLVWNVMLAASIVIMSAGAYFALKGNFGRLIDWLQPAEAQAAEVMRDDGKHHEMRFMLAQADIEIPEEAEGRPKFAVFKHPAMGTEFEIYIYQNDRIQSVNQAREAAEAAFARIDDIENRISRWIPSSQTSRINRIAHKEPVRVSPELFDLLMFSKKINRETGHAFDITILPLLQAWESWQDENRLPSDDEVATVAGKVGMEHLEFDRQELTVSFGKEGMALDFGGIGKGVAVDEAVEVLEAFGVTSGLVHGGNSSVRAMDAPPGLRGWSVKVEHPFEPDTVLREVIIHNTSMSTSARARNPLVIDGKTLGHIIDPRKGWPSDGIESVTVVTPSAAYADALSTAFFVMGPEKIERFHRDHPKMQIYTYADGELERYNGTCTETVVNYKTPGGLTAPLPLIELRTSRT